MKRAEVLKNIEYILRDTTELDYSEIAESIVELQEELDLLRTYDEN